MADKQRIVDEIEPQYYLKLKDWFNHDITRKQHIEIPPTLIQLGINIPFTSTIEYYPMVVDCVSDARWWDTHYVLAFGKVYYENEPIELVHVRGLGYTCQSLEYTDNTEIKKLFEVMKTSKRFQYLNGFVE